MRALQFTSAANDARATRITRVSTPRPAASEVTIDVEYAGINFKDVMARRGDTGYVDEWPFVPGLEAAGTVREVGAGVTDLARGDRVVAFTGQGALAEVVTAPAALVCRVPDGLVLADAAAAPGVLLTARLLEDAVGGVTRDHVVLVHSAAGGVGQAVAQAVRARGARLLGAVGHRSRVQAALDAGYEEVFVRGPELAREIAAAAGDRGVDVILDPQGTTMLAVDLEVAAPGARIVVFGNAAGAPFDPVAVGRLMAGNVSLGGFSLSALAAQDPDRVARALDDVLRRLARGELAVATAVSEGLEAAPGLHDALAGGYSGAKPLIHL